MNLKYQTSPFFAGVWKGEDLCDVCLRSILFSLKTIIFPFNEDLIPNQQIIEKFFKKTHLFDEI